MGQASKTQSSSFTRSFVLGRAEEESCPHALFVSEAGAAFLQEASAVCCARCQLLEDFSFFSSSHFSCHAQASLPGNKLQEMGIELFLSKYQSFMIGLIEIIMHKNQGFTYCKYFNIGKSPN